MERSMRTGTFFWQYRHCTSSTLLGTRRISPSQALQPMLIIPGMKPFIMILLVALSVEAQSVADAARKERARRSELPTVRVLTNEDARAARTLAGDPEEPKATTPQSTDAAKAADAKADAAKATDKPASQTTKTPDTKATPADPTQA